MGLAVGVNFVYIPQGGSQHTLSECLVLMPLVIPRENLFCVSTKGELPDDVSLSGACFGSQKDFLAQGATVCHKYLAPLYHRPKKYLISIDHNCCRFTVLFATPTVVALS